MAQGIKFIVEDSLANDVQSEPGEKVFHLHSLTLVSRLLQDCQAPQVAPPKHANHALYVPPEWTPHARG